MNDLDKFMTTAMAEELAALRDFKSAALEVMGKYRDIADGTGARTMFAFLAQHGEKP